MAKPRRHAKRVVSDSDNDDEGQLPAPAPALTPAQKGAITRARNKAAKAAQPKAQNKRKTPTEQPSQPDVPPKKSKKGSASANAMTPPDEDIMMAPPEDGNVDERAPAGLKDRVSDGNYEQSADEFEVGATQGKPPRSESDFSDVLEVDENWQGVELDGDEEETGGGKKAKAIVRQFNQGRPDWADNGDGDLSAQLSARELELNTLSEAFLDNVGNQNNDDVRRSKSSNAAARHSSSTVDHDSERARRQAAHSNNVDELNDHPRGASKHARGSGRGDSGSDAVGAKKSKKAAALSHLEDYNDEVPDDRPTLNTNATRRDDASDAQGRPREQEPLIEHPPYSIRAISTQYTQHSQHTQHTQNARRAPDRLPSPRDRRKEASREDDRGVEHVEQSQRTGRTHPGASPDYGSNNRGTHPSQDGQRARQHAYREPAESDDEWPVSTNAIPPPKGGRMTIGDQPLDVQAVIREACAKEMPAAICFKNAFPLSDRREALLLDVLINSAKKLKKKNIVSRLEKDPAYVTLMCQVPEWRISNYRLKFKEAAEHIVQDRYELDAIDSKRYVKIMKRVLRPKSRLYIFPGELPNMVFQKGGPFCHRAVIDVIRQAVFGPKASPRFPRAMYVALARNKKQRPELPRPMVALACTAIDAGLCAYQLSPTVSSKNDFKADVYTKVYDEHMARLRRLERKHPEAYHNLMADLYAFASGNDKSDNGEAPIDGNNDGHESESDSEVDDEDFCHAFEAE
ncbi:hypothetical protein FA95DRAFT_1611468 [Auriscalpium vulgare]|uniref:Uncharacterized protein n=1 Tax=Auriscalpium vulgare TaxID=40419 RepID=A0ACB8R9N1_9AGAM|nr:hypothetical protein FA95DRAFT_1611468 [Auriscalpium vulgare]